MISADLPAVVALEQECLGGWNEAQLAGHLNSSAGWAMVGGVDATGRVSFFACGMMAAGEAEIYRLVVAPSCRRRGYGKALLEQVLCSLRNNGSDLCWLEVRSSNRAAIALYRRCGFQEQGRRPRYYSGPTEDAVLMHKNLSEGVFFEEHQGP